MLRDVSTDAVQSFRRKLGHSALRNRCERIASGKNFPQPRPLSIAASTEANARLVAQAFVDLQEERHLADDAHAETFDLVRLNEAIALARRALAAASEDAHDSGMAALLLACDDVELGQGRYVGRCLRRP